LILVLLAIGTGCSLMPALLQPSQPQQSEGQSGGQSEDQPSAQLMQRFEQKIADRLLAESPVVPIVRTSAQAKILIEQLDKLVNQSGLNLDLLTSLQRNQLLGLSEAYRALKFEQHYWSTRNHLADVSHLQQEVATIDQSAPGSELITAIQENIQEQDDLDILYPKPLQLAALSALQRQPEDQRTDELGAYLRAIQTTADVGPWIRARLQPFFTEQQLIEALVELQSRSSSIRKNVDTSEKKQNRPLEEFYSDPLYDIRLEANPEQLTLDIISLHIEEALQFRGREKAVTILGLSSNSTGFIKADEKSVTVFLDPITELPAFEFQSIAYQTAGELLASTRWPFPWRRTLALAYGQWTAEQLAEQGYFSDDESKLARLTQQMLFIQLAIIETKLALGQWSYLDAKMHLQQETPYNAEQVDRWLLQMLTEDGSYAAAALAARAFSGQDKDLINVLAQEMERLLPGDLSDLLNRPKIKKSVQQLTQ
jgi:hypothetical protein